MWLPELVPDAVIFAAAPPSFGDARTIDPAVLLSIAADRQGEDGRHIVIADPAGDHRLWLTDTGPGRRLAVLIPLDGDFRLRLDGALRLHRLLLGERTGPPPRRIVLTPLQRSRLILMLRAIDGHRAGASYREIATVLLDPAANTMPARDWKTSAPHSRVFRLVRDAFALINGGYRRLFRGD